MKKTIFMSSLGSLILLLGIYSFTPEKGVINTQTIEWLTLEEALEKNGKNQKKIFIDFYTDWCGWCKVMDKKTFTNPDVIKYMNTHFYAVKFDAEQKEALQFKGKEYQFVDAGRRGIHTFAYEMMDQRASYPSFVVLDKNLEKSSIMRGFQQPQQLLNKLKDPMIAQ